MTKNIEGLNYDSKLSVDDLSFQGDTVERELLDRTRIVFGAESLTVPRFGVIDAVDPRTVTESEITRSLIVYTSTTNALQINIAPGTAVTPNGAIVRNPALLENLDLAQTNANDINIVFIENTIVDGGPIRKTRFNTDQATRRLLDDTVIRVALLANFNNATTFPPIRLANIVVLAVVVVVSTTSGNEIQIDYTNLTYDFNRPWYSPVDIEHRMMIGAGTPTSSNIHGITFGDLVSGSLTIFDQMLQTGGVLARDDALKGIPGTTCVETITAARILTDTAGTVTAKGRFGGAGATYIVLSKYPVHISAFYQSSHKGRAIAWEHIPGTRIVILPAPETFTVDSIVKYNEVFALEPPSQVVSNNITFGQPQSITSELIITGGQQLTTMVDPSIDFDGSGSFPVVYTVYAKADGTLLRAPQPIQTSIVLEDIGITATTITANFTGPAKLRIGLANANAGSTMSITIQLTGTDDGGNVIIEDITFSGTTWVQPTIPGSESASQFVYTTNLYLTLTEIQVINRTADGPGSLVQFWSEIETETTLVANRMARAALVYWDGMAISKIMDARDIHKNIPPPVNRFEAGASFAGTGGTLPSLIATDDFVCPQLRDSTDDSQVAIAATFTITVNDYTTIQAGDSILFPTAKTIVAIVAGAPTRSIGEYLAGTSTLATRDDMVLTINDVTFDSGFTALGNITLPGELTCSANTLGARGNGPVSEPIEGDISAISISGDAVGGIDAFGESFNTRFNDCIDTSLPSIGTYDVTAIRGRYLSVPVPIDSKLSVRVILHGVPAPQTNIQVRARYALGSSEVWVPWEVLTGDGTVFTTTQASVITKIQFEFFGKVCGFSLYEMP